MYRLYIVILLAIFSIQLHATQEDHAYYVIIKGEEVVEGFFSPRKVFHIKTPKYGGFVNGSVYIKPHEFISSEEIIKIIKSVADVKISIEKIEIPFTKFSGSDMLLRKSRLDIIYRVSTDYENSLKLAKAINSHASIEYCVPEAYYQMDETPNDPLLKDQTGLTQIGAATAWDKAKPGKNIMIGIVDSGIDIDHNDLKEQIFINTAEIPGNGIDDDGNGFIDDINGWDFVGNITEVQAQNKQWQQDNNPKPAFSNNDHGTHVGGIAAATTNNGIGMASLSWGATIIAVKCATDNLSAQTGSRNIYRPYEGMLYAAMMGADIINCSWSSEFHDPLMYDVINSILERNIAIVAAAGNFMLNNDEFPFYPASLPGIISVGSINKNGSPSGFTHFGINVDIFAPGDGIVSTMPQNIYNTKSGTSMSAPFVSSLIALFKHLNPEIGIEEVRHRIRSSAELYNPGLHTLNRFLFGKLDAARAMTQNYPDGPTSPGISVETILIQGGDAISSYNATDLQFNFHNYLASTNDVQIKIYTKGNYISPASIEFTIDEFDSKTTIEKQFTYQLSELNPWFEGSIDFVIEYRTDAGYFNIEIVKVPIDLPTYNSYLVVETSPEYDEIIWLSASSAGRFDFWVGGFNYDMNGGMIYHWGRTLGFFPNDTVQAVQAFSVARAFGAISGGNMKSYVVSTKDSGRTWQSEDVSNFVKKIHGIAVFEDETIIAFGEKLKSNQSFGIARKEGNSWIAIDNTFELKPGETLVRGSYAFKDNKVMAGTNSGRVIYSNDRGKSWDIADVASEGMIKNITIINKDSAVAFGPGVGTSNFSGKVHNTVNGGQTWVSNVFDFKTIERVPIYTYCPDSSKSVVVLHSNGEVTSSEDLGYNWRHELTMQYGFGKVNTGAGYTTSGKSRLWNQAYDIGFVEFDIIPINAKYSMSIAGKDTIDFDTTSVHSAKYANIFLINDGNMRLNKFEQMLLLENGTTEDEIILSEEFSSSFAPEKLESAELKFAPITTGDKLAKLKITTQAGENVFHIQGKAYDPASVNFEESDLQFSVRFADNTLIINSDIVNFVNPIIEIFDIMGNSIEKANLTANGSQVEFKIEQSYYSTGIYLLLIENNNKIYSRKIIFVK